MVYLKVPAKSSLPFCGNPGSFVFFSKVTRGFCMCHSFFDSALTRYLASGLNIGGFCVEKGI